MVICAALYGKRIKQVLKIYCLYLGQWEKIGKPKNKMVKA